MERSGTTRTALILAAGRGSRMRRRDEHAAALSPHAQQLADRGLKGLIPVAGRPFLDHSLRRLAAVGIGHVCFIVSPHAAEMRAYGERAAEEFGVRVSYGVQRAPGGTADAVLAGEKALGGEPFLLCNCDNLYPLDALSRLVAVPRDACAVAGFDRDVLLERGNFDRQRFAGFAAIRMDERGNLAGIVEKPSRPGMYTHAGKVWVSMNLYRFTSAIFGFCRRIRPHPERGELELTDAVSQMIESGSADVRIVFCRGAVLDMTGKADIISVRRALEAGGEI